MLTYNDVFKRFNNCSLKVLVKIDRRACLLYPWFHSAIALLRTARLTKLTNILRTEASKVIRQSSYIMKCKHRFMN